MGEVVKATMFRTSPFSGGSCMGGAGMRGPILGKMLCRSPTVREINNGT